MNVFSNQTRKVEWNQLFSLLCLSLPVILSLLFLSQCDCAVGSVKDNAGVG